MGAQKVMQICWDCKNACCGCDWSLTGTPIPGWTARPTKDANGVESYEVTACPEFVRDAYGYGTSRNPPLTEKERLEHKRLAQNASNNRRYWQKKALEDKLKRMEKGEKLNA